jgi:oligogalacturonide lyase
VSAAGGTAGRRAGKGARWSSELSERRDARTGARIRQLTAAPAIHHHPFFTAPAWDDAMRRLVVVSYRAGAPQLFACSWPDGGLVQLTDRPDLSPWSLHPAHDGRWVYFLAGDAGWRVDPATLAEEQVCDLAGDALRDAGQTAGGMGTTTLSRDDRWWAMRTRRGAQARLHVVDTRTLERRTILERADISHLQFCPDDAGWLFYGGPVVDRVWAIRRDGGGNHRVYRRDAAAQEWITHESWLPGSRELAFVDWPHGMRAAHVETGAVRRLCSFNAWHASANRAGTLMVADTNFPDIGLQLFDPRDGVGTPTPLCHPGASSIGAHWAGPFPYDGGPIATYAPQHTHPHPSFSPDGRWVVYTSDASGHAQVHAVEVPAP